jgi:hypothetical protein
VEPSPSTSPPTTPTSFVPFTPPSNPPPPPPFSLSLQAKTDPFPFPFRCIAFSLFSAPSELARSLTASGDDPRKHLPLHQVSHPDARPWSRSAHLAASPFVSIVSFSPHIPISHQRPPSIFTVSAPLTKQADLSSSRPDTHTLFFFSCCFVSYRSNRALAIGRTTRSGPC